MNSNDLFKMGIKNLLRRKLRTFLTALGIVIGTVSIVVMVSMGIGLTKGTQEFAESMGDVTILEVRPSYDGSSKKNSEGRPIITLEQMEKIKEVANVEAVTPQVQEYFLLISGKFRTSLSVTGIDMSVAEKFGFEIKEGRYVNEDDRIAMIVGKEVPFEFRDPRKDNRRYRGGYDFNGNGEEEERVPNINILEDRIYYTFDTGYGTKYGGSGKMVKPEKIECVGIIDGDDWRTSNGVFVDVSTLKAMKTKYERAKGTYKKKRDEGYTEIRVKINEVKNVKDAQDKIKAMGFNANGMLDWVEEMKKQSRMVQMVFGGIGAISLLVAAIGITNTMIMAIYERRKEIGVMKVIGARIKDIKRLFLFESAAIGFIGGAIGLGVSYGLSFLINAFSKNMSIGMGSGDMKLSVIPLWLALSALGFTAMIGLISGYLPARKAMKLSALEAIKND